MQKKLLAVVLGIGLALSAVGCGSNSDTYTELEPGLQSKVEKLGEYKGLSYTWEEASVTDEELEQEIQYELEWYEEYEEITDRTVAQDGDVVDINFVGKIDGVAFENGSADNYELELGSGGFIPGFEEQIVGKEVGSDFQVNVTFPEDYDESLAGKDAVFDVKLNKIEKVIPAELTDEFVKENMDYESVEEYKAALKEDLINSKQSEIEDHATYQIAEQIVEKSEFKIEDTDIDHLVEEQMASYESYAAMYEMELEDFMNQFLGCSVDEWKEITRADVEEEIKVALVFSNIVKKEKLGVSQEEYEKAVTEEMADYECETIEEFEEQFGKDDYIYNMLYNKVSKFLLEQSQKQ